MGPMGMGQSSMNVNQQMIRPLLLNMTVVFLFLLPLITMRTYAEEKRSGTIELLLTSPLTDVEIVAGKFLGAMGLYACDARGVRCCTSACCLRSERRNGSRWPPAYLGLLLFGGVFHRRRPVHLEPHEEPDRRRRGDLRRVPAASG